MVRIIAPWNDSRSTGGEGDRPRQSLIGYALDLGSRLALRGKAHLDDRPIFGGDTELTMELAHECFDERAPEPGRVGAQVFRIEAGAVVANSNQEILPRLPLHLHGDATLRSINERMLVRIRDRLGHEQAERNGELRPNHFARRFDDELDVTPAGQTASTQLS